MGCQHGMEIPFTLDIPAALVAEKVTGTDKIMGDLASAYWAQFAKTGDPNGSGRPEWPRHDPSVDRIIHFTNSGIIVGHRPAETQARPVGTGLEPRSIEPGSDRSELARLGCATGAAGRSRKEGLARLVLVHLEIGDAQQSCEALRTNWSSPTTATRSGLADSPGTSRPRVEISGGTYR